MFGYKLKLVKNDDLQQYEVFQKTVFTIQDQTENTIRWFDSFDITDDSIKEIGHNIESINKLMDIYFENKYSSPTTSMNFFKAMDEIKKWSNRMIDVMMIFVKLGKIKSSADKQIENGTNEFDINSFESDMDKAVELYNKQLDTCIVHIIKLLQFVKMLISGDLMKLIIGVDIMLEHKSRLKRLPKNNELLSEFTIRYKAITEDDNQFLQKEKVKNERNRT